MEVVVPGEAGNVRAGQGQAGAAGGLNSGAQGSVSVVPSLGLGLSPTLGAGAAPAPLVQPALSAAVLPAPAVQPAASVSPLPPAKKAVSTQRALDKIFGKPPLPPAIDAPSHSAASAGEIDAHLVKEAAKTAAPGSAQSQAELKAFYDGASDRTTDTETGILSAGPGNSAHASGLKASAGLAGKTGFKPVPPAAPKNKPASNWISGALGTVSGAAGDVWATLKSPFHKPVPASQSPTVRVLAPAAMPQTKLGR
ncbi:MAG: hypothetical protein COV48_08200, partial [Elusimicrobia bacterium CG11_big_fil_rev_8_21_14_0_20_64_6]